MPERHLRGERRAPGRGRPAIPAAGGWPRLGLRRLHSLPARPFGDAGLLASGVPGSCLLKRACGAEKQLDTQQEREKIAVSWDCRDEFPVRQGPRFKHVQAWERKHDLVGHVLHVKLNESMSPRDT